MSQIVLYPDLYASEFASVSSGNWIKIKVLFPSSFEFNLIRASAVVADPEKKSTTIEFSSVVRFKI